MRISEEIKKTILESGAKNIASIIGGYLTLTKSGRSLSGCCPFHGEKTPSFVVSPERGTWRCFGSCSEGGDVANFLMKVEGINFGEALQSIALHGGITIPGATDSPEEKERKSILSTLAMAGEYYKSQVEASIEIRDYIESRMTPEMVKEFGIGFAPKNGGKALYNHLKALGCSEDIAEKAGLIRKDDKGIYRDVFWGGRMMFPIKNAGGYTIGFAGRRIDGETAYKYVNSPETKVYKKYSTFYGLNKAILTSGEVFVVEGYLDYIQMWSSGTKNVVATCGTAFTKDHLAVLKKLGVHRLNLMFDGDKAGIKATQKTVLLACKEEFTVRVYPLAADQDPDSFFKNGGKIEEITPVSGFDYLEQSGIKLEGTLRELHRLERMERVMLYFMNHNPQVSTALKKSGRLEQLFSPDGLAQIQGL